MVKRRGILLASAVLTAAVIIGAGGTYAWFSSTKQADNDFTVGQVNIGVVENDDTEHPYEGGSNGDFTAFSSEGDERVKAVQIVNLDKEDRAVPAYVRARIVPIWRDANGNGIAVPARITLLDGDENWEQLGDCYYYTLPVDPGDMTGYLMEKVRLDSDVPAGATLEIEVLADAVQAEGGAASEAWGSAAAALLTPLA